METNKVVRMECARIIRRMEELATVLLIALALFTGVVCYSVAREGRLTREAIAEAQQEATQQAFDVSAFDAWCKGEDMGTVRMVGGWFSSAYDDAVFLEDETGNVWEVDRGLFPIQENDFLLLWIADNGTDDVTDDVVIKIWNEVHY